jgi:hypothetical protein
MPPTLPNPVTLIGSFFSAIANYLNNEAIKARFAELISFLWQFVNVVESIAIHVASIFRNVDLAWGNFKGWLEQVGGDVKGIGIDNWAMWHHLRTVLMPNTINYIWDWVWLNWIKPLRQGLVKTIGWVGRWVWWLTGRIHDQQGYTYTVQKTGRNYRQRYVYPQLLFLLSPWRVAYNYAAQITVAVANYLDYSHHSETRDTISRVVYSGMGRLWQSFDKHLAEWLLTDVSSNGWGSEVPEFPSDARTPPPGKPPSTWEPYVTEPKQPPYPPGAPDIPRVDYSY